MLISHLLLRNFGKFENFACDFSPGLNLIKGPNDAGKSTLAQAISIALFADPVDKPKELAHTVKWGSHESPILEMLLDVDGKSFHLIKNFGSGVAELESSDTGADVKSADSITQWLSEQMGMSSGDLFESTSCINQGEISQIDNSIEAIKDKLESLVSGGREEKVASFAISKLDEQVAKIAGVDTASSGETARLKALSSDLDYNLQKLAQDIALIKAKRADLIQVEMAFRNVSEDLAVRKCKLERGQKATKLEKEFLDISREFHLSESILNETQSALKAIKDLRDRQTDLKSVDRSDLDEVSRLDSSLNYLHPKRAELELEAHEAGEHHDSYKIGAAYIFLAPLGFLGSAVLSLLHLTGFIQISPYILWLGVFTTLTIFAASLGIIVVRYQQRNSLKKRAEDYQSRLQEIDFDLQTKADALSAILSKYAVGSVDEFRRILWQFDEGERQVSKERERYERILGGQSLQVLERRHRALEDQFALISKERKELAQYNISDEELSREALIVGQYEERIKDLERERLVLRQQIESAEGGSELLASFKERKENLDARANSLTHGLKVHQLTKDCIIEARQNVLVSTLEVLNVRTSDLLNKLTSGRYSRVRFDKSTFKFEVFSDERHDWIDPEQGLSSGTADQVYLAARLALADLISEDKNPVMILDDPFVNYDEKRLDNAMKVIKELSENHQILLLTSQSHYDKWADATIAL
jgi:DNA repair exonuclease SbcCD ATPase subunit